MKNLIHHYAVYQADNLQNSNIPITLNLYSFSKMNVIQSVNNNPID